MSGAAEPRGFDRGSSDIDVLVATAGMPPRTAIERLAALHAALRAAGGWTAGLEGGVPAGRGAAPPRPRRPAPLPGRCG